MLAIALAGCSAGVTVTGDLATPAPTRSPAATVANALTRTSDAGNVTVSATWAGLAAGASFEVVLDTHSVDLDALDLAGALLRNDRADELRAQPWSAAAGGHHRAGQLTFDGDFAPFLAGARWIELVIVDVGDQAERVLRWDL